MSHRSQEQNKKECPVCQEDGCPGCEIPDDAMIGYYITGSYEERVESGLQAAIERWEARNP